MVHLIGIGLQIPTIFLNLRLNNPLQRIIIMRLQINKAFFRSDYVQDISIEPGIGHTNKKRHF